MNNFTAPFMQMNAHNQTHKYRGLGEAVQWIAQQLRVGWTSCLQKDSEG